MKILQTNTAALTNFEVLDFLRGREATSDPMGALALWHLQSARGSIVEFLKRYEKFKLAKAEKLNIINLRPSNQAIIDPVIEHCEKRLVKDETQGIDEVQELVDLVLEVLPAPQLKPKEMQEQEEMPVEEPMEET